MPLLLQCYMTSILARPVLRFDTASRPLLANPSAGALHALSFCVCVHGQHCGAREEHQRHVRMVFKTLSHHKLYAKRSKCLFARSKVAFLGHILSVNTVKADPAKVKVVRHWATPTSCVEMWRFVGLANYFRLCIKRFSALAAPHWASGYISLGRQLAAQF